MRKTYVLKIIAFELGTTNSYNRQQDSCHWQLMCHETNLRFNIQLREIFPKSGFVRVMKKYNESALMYFLQEFGSL